MTEKFKQSILDSIKKGGFASELKVSKCTNKRNWLTLNNYVYFDKDKKVNREIDLLCIKGSKYNRFSELELKINLTIEVKKSEKNPWVFFIGKNEPTTLEHGFFSLTSYRNINHHIFEGLFQEYPRQKIKYVATSYCEAFRDSEVSNIYKAVDSSMKATYYFHNGNLLNKRKENIPDEEFASDLFEPIDKPRASQLVIFIPLIVLDGVLIKAHLDKKLELQVEESTYIPYESYYIDDTGHEHFYAMDIISINYLNKYLLELEKWLEKVGEKIMKIRKQ